MKKPVGRFLFSFEKLVWMLQFCPMLARFQFSTPELNFPFAFLSPLFLRPSYFPVNSRVKVLTEPIKSITTTLFFLGYLPIYWKTACCYFWVWLRTLSNNLLAAHLGQRALFPNNWSAINCLFFSTIAKTGKEEERVNRAVTRKASG